MWWVLWEGDKNFYWYMRSESFFLDKGLEKDWGRWRFRIILKRVGIWRVEFVVGSGRWYIGGGDGVSKGEGNTFWNGDIGVDR